MGVKNRSDSPPLDATESEALALLTALKDTPDYFFWCLDLPRTRICPEHKKIIFYTFFPDSLGTFESKFWGGGAYAILSTKIFFPMLLR